MTILKIHWTCWMMTTFLLFVCYKPIHGVATAEIRCLGGAYADQLDAVLVCSLLGRVVSGMRWVRPDDTEVMRCNAANTKCTPSALPSAYNYFINSPTQVTLTIHSFSVGVDAGKWTCRDGETGVGQDQCNKTVYHAITKVTMTHPVSPVKPGVPVETVCKTNPTFPQANISWVLSNTTITDGVSAASLLGPDFGVVTISTLKRNYAPEDSGQALVCVASNGEMTVFSQTWQPITAGTKSLLKTLLDPEEDLHQGVATAEIRCLGGAYADQLDAVLVCSLLGRVVSGMRWVRPDDKEVMRCNAANTKCTPSALPSAYTYFINSPTQVTLTIHSFSIAVDAGKWTCRDGETGVGQDQCNKTVYHAITKVTMTHPVSAVKPGVPVETVCKTNPTFPQANISWVLSNTTITDGVSTASLLGPDFGVVTISTLKRNYAPEDSGQALVCVASNGEMTVFSQTWQPITAGTKSLSKTMQDSEEEDLHHDSTAMPSYQISVVEATAIAVATIVLIITVISVFVYYERMKLEEAIRNESKSKTITGEATVTGEGRVTGEGTVTAYDNPAYVETE